MFFCEDDYIKIYKWLLKQGKKDSAFDETYELNGDEMITILQKGSNMKITLSELLHQVANLGCKDFYNLTANKGLYKISFSEALNEVPDNVKKIGIIITFLDTDSKWRVFHFNGTSKQQWFQTSLWEEYKISSSKGTTKEKPVAPEEGYEYYDSNLKKKILYNGTSWVNIDGTVLK